MQRQMEDIDNRGRKNNLRVRVPESIEYDQIQQTVTAIFNNLLERPATERIEMERIHRALRPKGSNTDPPRDIICCLTSFCIKEEILRKVCNRIHITHESAISKYINISQT